MTFPAIHPSSLLSASKTILLTLWFLPAVTLGAAPAGAEGEQLYNGIRLPVEWPPEVGAFTGEPIEVPYLRSPPQVIPIDVGRQLFVDGFLVEETTLTRTYHRLEPYEGNPILEPQESWEKEGLYKGRTGTCAMPFSDGVWYDPADKTFKMWYMAALLQRTCYAVSKDGLHWTKPSLDVRPGTNVVHEGMRDSTTVWLDHEEKDPQKRFKMVRFQKSPQRGLMLHYSPDGIHWSNAVARGGPCHDRTTVFYNPFRKVWVVSAKGTIPANLQNLDIKHHQVISVRRYREGADLPSAMDWQKHEDAGVWLWADTREQMRNAGIHRHRIYNVDAVAYESIMLGMLSIFHGDGDGSERSRYHMNDVCLGFSRDGFYWHRPDRRAFIGGGDEKTDWNWCNVQSVGGCCLVVGDKLYFYYSGRRKKSEEARTGVGFLRRDGFASMDAGASQGTLTTRPVRYSGKYLFVNVDTAGGELRVEVLDRSGKVIEPFSQSNCLPVGTDSTLQQVSWKGAEDLSALAGKPVRFRFHLKKGRLYAFWISPQLSGASYGYVAAGGPGFTGPTDTIGAGAYND